MFDTVFSSLRLDMKPITNRLKLTSALLATSMAFAAHAQTTKQVACNGQLIGGPKPQSPLQIAAQLEVCTANVDLDLGSGKLATQIVSNNNIQLQFSTKEFTGEYFHLTGDLFLIYKSGQLARLRCKQALNLTN
jgi:hypothetical protein